MLSNIKSLKKCGEGRLGYVYYFAEFKTAVNYDRHRDLPSTHDLVYCFNAKANNFNLEINGELVDIYLDEIISPKLLFENLLLTSDGSIEKNLSDQINAELIKEVNADRFSSIDLNRLLVEKFKPQFGVILRYTPIDIEKTEHYSHVIKLIDQNKRSEAFSYIKALSFRDCFKHYLYGIIYENEGSLDKAIKEYSESLNCENGYSRANVALGRTYFKSFNPESALECFLRAIQDKFDIDRKMLRKLLDSLIEEAEYEESEKLQKYKEIKQKEFNDEL